MGKIMTTIHALQNIGSLNSLKKFWNDEEAQTTMEYILLLGLILIILGKFKSSFVQFLSELVEKLQGKADKLTDDPTGG